MKKTLASTVVLAFIFSGVETDAVIFASETIQKNGTSCTTSFTDSSENKQSYIYDANGDYTIKDENGHSFRHFLSDGTKRRSYTVDEAVSVVNGNGKNTFSVRYR